MSGVVEWLPKTATEVCLRYADFADELASGDSLSSATCAATVWSGNDGAPAIVAATTVIANTAGINTVAQVKLQAGVLGTIYQCIVTGITVSGLTLTKTASLAIKLPLN